MNTSPEINELASALSKAQASMKPAHKGADNPFHNSKYADLCSVWETCRKPLTDNGLAVIQTADADIKSVTVSTRLVHTSGQWVESTLAMPNAKPTPQGIGSVLTYARRYSLAAIVGVAPEGDDDDAEASEKSSRKPQAYQRPEPVDQQTVDTAIAHLDGMDTQADVERFMGIVVKSKDNNPATKTAITNAARKRWVELTPKKVETTTTALMTEEEEETFEE